MRLVALLLKVCRPILAVPIASRRQCLLDGPAKSETLSDRRGGQADTARPVSNRQRFTGMTKNATHARVARLFGLCGPSTVTRFIVPVVVDAIERVLHRGSASNIAQECREVARPFNAHRNPAPSIVGVFGIVGIVTAGLHSGPHDVFWRSGHSVRPIVRWLPSEVMPDQESRVFVFRGTAAAARAEHEQILTHIAPVNVYRLWAGATT